MANSEQSNPIIDGGIPLCSLAPGMTGIILEVGGDMSFQARLRNMGLREGMEIEMIKQAPLADPLEYRVGVMHLSLRRHEAGRILVEPN